MKFIIKSPRILHIFLFALIFSTVAVVTTNAQNRARVVQPKQTKKAIKTQRRRGLRNKIVVVKKPQNKSLVKKTASTKTTKSNIKANRNYLPTTTRSMMMNSIQRKIGIRYRLGTQGPSRYDCSGFVWKVFQDTGINFTRTSARQFWRTFDPVYGDDRFEFGTLVFFNRLGHMGIVADKNGFYHASSSKGVTYSKFKGYWSKRIVGYRRVPKSYFSWEKVLNNEAGN